MKLFQSIAVTVVMDTFQTKLIFHISNRSGPSAGHCSVNTVVSLEIPVPYGNTFVDRSVSNETPSPGTAATTRPAAPSPPRGATDRLVKSGRKP